MNDYPDFNEEEFELDFTTALNMMLGKDYKEAREEAKKWMEEARE